MVNKNHYGLYVLDVGHGNCSVIICEEGVVIIDAGPKSPLLSFLKEMDIDTIDYFILSHADEDHIAGLYTVIINNINVSHVFLNSDSKKQTKVWDDLVFVLDEKVDTKLIVGLHESQDDIRMGEITIGVCAPSAYLTAKGVGSFDRKGQRITHNSISAVMLLKYKDHPQAILPGDLDSVGLENWHGTSAPILIFPHHGGRPGKADVGGFVYDLIDKTNPKFVLFSISRTKLKLPKPDIIKHLKQLNPDIHIACTQLSPNCSETLPHTSADPGYYSFGKEKGHCCAGTIFIELGEGAPNLIHKDKHNEFVKKQVSYPMCV